MSRHDICEVWKGYLPPVGTVNHSAFMGCWFRQVGEGILDVQLIAWDSDCRGAVSHHKPEIEDGPPYLYGIDWDYIIPSEN